jgi:N-acetylglucosamine-6-phosphate deacetylase
MIYRARHYRSGTPIAVTVEANHITSIESIAKNALSPELWIAPAFFDPQINGCLGISFNAAHLSPEGVHTIAAKLRQHGIGGFCPTLITAEFDALRHGFTTLAKAVNADRDLSRRLPYYHLEGPYLSAEDGPRGAHPREHLRTPNWNEFRALQDAAEGRIRMVPLAPEGPGALPFIELLTAAGVVVAIGHTAATVAQIRSAVAAGARISTHLGNGCHSLLPRHDNYVWEQLACDDLWASVITDGYHLPASILKCIVRVKGLARLLITCDSSSLAGLPTGRYREWGSDLEVLSDGKVVVPGTPFLAGSGHFTDTCVSTALRITGLDLGDAIDLASAQPRKLLGLPVTAIEVGQPADLMLFEWEEGGELKVREVL